jgi:hypothetical protein
MMRDTFSPYEIAIMGRAIAFVVGASAMAAWFPHPSRVTGFAFGIGAILFLLTPVTAFMWDALSRCPTCDKSAMARRRLWPERRCSECGTALDTRP